MFVSFTISFGNNIIKSVIFFILELYIFICRCDIHTYQNFLKHVKAWLESFSCTPSSAPCGLTLCQTRTAGFRQKEKTWRNMAEPRRKSVHALLHMQSWCSVQVNPFVGIKKNINFFGKDFLKGKVVACFYTILSKFGNKLLLIVLPVCRSSFLRTENCKLPVLVS